MKKKPKYKLNHKINRYQVKTECGILLQDLPADENVFYKWKFKGRVIIDCPNCLKNFFDDNFVNRRTKYVMHRLPIAEPSIYTVRRINHN